MKKDSRRFRVQMNFRTKPYDVQIGYSGQFKTISLYMTSDYEHPVWVDVTPEELWNFIERMKRKKQKGV